MAPVVLFDFDYTLADSSRGAVECIRYALESDGLPVPPTDAILATIGLSLPDVFGRLAPGGCPRRLAALFIARADAVAEGLTEVYGDTAAVARALADRGWRLGIASTKFRRRIEAILRRESLLPHFAVVIGGEDVARHKPDPECILRAMERLAAAPADVIYVGDSVPDGEAARAAGVRFVGVLSGVTPRSRLLELGPLAVVDHLAELVPLLDSLTRAAGRPAGPAPH